VQKKDGIQTGRRQRWTAAEKQQWLGRYASSGQTQASFCRAHGLAVPTFSAWRLRQRRLRRTGELIEVPAPAGVAATIHGGGGVSVAIMPGTDVAWVVRLVRALQCGA
jgi:transposase-like protein